MGLAAITVLALAVSFALGGADDDPERVSSGRDSESSNNSDDDGDDSAANSEDPQDEQPDGAFFRTDYEGLADPAGFTKPYPNAKLEGLLTFRGNPSRTYYGKGPVPRNPQVLHRFPDEPMCKSSSNLGTTKVWCGMGWTGQPLIAEREDRRWSVFGGYDGHIHFIDALTGERILPDVETGDIIKGTPTIDPDGYPLVYSGSRDDLLRIMAIDRTGQAEVLWTLDSESVQPVLWNDDWDSTPIILQDHMIIGSESSRFWVIKLNRSYDAAGLVQVAPEVVFTTEAWDQAALASNGDETASVESSVAVYENTAYFGTSAGLIWGYDLGPLLESGAEPKQVFRFYSGNDHDATMAIDDEGMLYVAGEYDRDLQISRDVGQLVKLDPSKPGNPIVWTFQETSTLTAGVYGSPGINGDVVYITSNAGRLIALDRTTGVMKWELRLPGPTWASPVIVDDVLLVGDCAGVLHAFDVSNPDGAPPELWAVELGGCIEATPAVWDGRIYLGTRAGHLFIIGDPEPAPTTTSTSR
jgi:outer membrane protein assembly factor BamB